MGLIDNTLQSVGSLINMPLNLQNQTTKNSDKKAQKSEEAEDQNRANDKSGKTLVKQNAKANEKTAEKLSQKATEKPAEKTGDKLTQKAGEKLTEKADAQHQNKAVEVAVSLKSTVLDVVHQGLSKHAQEAGLPENEQTKFATEHTDKFVAHTIAKGVDKLLKATGDLQLLQLPTPIFTAKHEGKKVEIELGHETLKDLNVRVNLNNGSNGNGLQLKLGAEAHLEGHNERRENGQSEADVRLSMQFGINRSTTQRATIEARMQAQENQNQTTLDVKLQSPQLPQLPKLPTSQLPSNLPQIPQPSGNQGVNVPIVNVTVNVPATLPHESSHAQTTNQSQQVYQQISTPQIHEIKDTILNKITDILQSIVTANGGEQRARRGEIGDVRDGKMSDEISAENDSPEQTLEKILYSGGKREGGEGDGEQEGQTENDNALFTSAFGISSESGEVSRKKHGDGLMLDFVNFGGTETPVKLDPKVFMASLLKVLQNGSEAGFGALQSAASKDLSPATFDGIRQISAKLDADGTKHLVYGVVTLNVMNQEIVERLSHVSSGTHTGLSDDALASLQKAHNSLRDHLTSNDLVGALGDVKGSPVSVSGLNYGFLPEVQEALNSLRDARSRIMSETMHVKNDVSGANSQQRFSMEADTLLEVTRRIEDYLKIK